MTILAFLPLLLVFAAVIALFLGGGLVLLRRTQAQAASFGYPSLGAYLRAVPRTDAERKAAFDLALKGFVMCLLALLFPPLLLVGVIPLFYGVRKTGYAALGLGLVDDAYPTGE